MGGDMDNISSPLTYLPISRRTIGVVGLTAALLLGVPAGAFAGGTPLCQGEVRQIILLNY